MTDSRLPSGYETPQAASKYTKLLIGTTKLRILSQPIIWRLDRKEELVDGKQKKKPLRFPMDKKPSVVYNPKWLKHFRCTIVWNYELWELQAREITQASIRNLLQALIADDDFKDIYSYDLKITREWEKLDTKYTILPWKVTDVDPAILSAYSDAQADLTKLFEWKHWYKENE